jgi:hypothetical protein
MPLCYEELDDTTRSLMLEELAADAANKTMQFSKWLTEAGRNHWPGLLRRAMTEGDDTTLARDLRWYGYLESHQILHRNDRPYRSRVPYTAADTLAECEFNHYYCRAICRRSLDGDNGMVEVYRSKPVRMPRPRSRQIIGMRINAQRLLDDLRAHPGGIDAALGVPAGPNSGLSVRRVKVG